MINPLKFYCRVLISSVIFFTLTNAYFTININLFNFLFWHNKCIINVEIDFRSIFVSTNGWISFSH